MGDLWGISKQFAPPCLPRLGLEYGATKPAAPTRSMRFYFQSSLEAQLSIKNSSLEHHRCHRCGKPDERCWYKNCVATLFTVEDLGMVDLRLSLSPGEVPRMHRNINERSSSNSTHAWLCFIVCMPKAMRSFPLQLESVSTTCHARLFWLLFVIYNVVIAGRPITGGPSKYPLINASSLDNSTDAGYHTHELDDERVNPENNITCVGQTPDLRLPLLQDGFNPNMASMQQLCAKTKYGGGQAGQHAGAYCWIRPGTASHNNIGNDTTGDVGFDLSLGAQTSAQLQNPRFLLACFYRCFCNYGLENPSIQPKSKYTYFRTSTTRSFFSYELQLDLDNDFTTSRQLKRGKQGWRRVKSTRVPERPENAQISSPSAGMGLQYITLDAGNEIECRGDLPTFVLPAPYATSDFGSLQELCATQMNGGNMLVVL